MAAERYGFAPWTSNPSPVAVLLATARMPADRRLPVVVVRDVRGALGANLEIVRIRRGAPLDQLPEEIVELAPQPRVVEYVGAAHELEHRVTGLSRDGRVDVDAC